MRISNKYKFIFLSNPKTGSESLRKMLDPYTDIYSNNINHHYNIEKTISLLNTKDLDYKNYFIFGFIRNPWERAVSYYVYSKPDDKCRGYWENNYNEDKQYIYNFNDWVKYHIDNNRPFYGLPSIKDFFYINNNICVDKIYKIEDIKDTITNINNKLNINISKIEYINKTDRKHYSLYYNYYSYEIIKNLLEFDIKYGDYKFDDMNITSIIA